MQGISIHTPHARRDLDYIWEHTDVQIISIHTPHARRDWDYGSELEKLIDFNPHASCEA